MAVNIFNYFRNSSNKYSQNVALVVDGNAYTYRDLSEQSGKLGYILHEFKQNNVGIFGLRSFTCYQGILAALASGKTYIPLNPKFPVERNLTIINLANLELLVVDQLGLEQITKMADRLTYSTVVFCPSIKEKDIPDVIKTKFTVIDSGKITESIKAFPRVNKNQQAYTMFTSGSTGIPKGVPISHENVSAYINYLKKRYDLHPTDRFTQTFDLTFDLSVHDMFLSWAVGASLYVIPEKAVMAPAKFIKENKITVWFSVPSLAQFMNKFGMLKENNFLNLRYSLFCGEALSKSIAIAWQKAAPNSILENIYGPTETTIGITHYRIPNEENKILEHHGVVAIGEVFKTNDYCLVNEQNEKVFHRGELCLSGSQVSSGYLNNNEKTNKSFFKFPSEDKVWYKTGDIVKVENENLFYISRKDFQVKIRGYRIELEEINRTIKKIINCDLVFTVPFPLSNGIAENLYSFIDYKCTREKNRILRYLKENLPGYMIPKDIIYLKEFPLNTNGKIDLKKLATKIGLHGK